MSTINNLFFGGSSRGEHQIRSYPMANAGLSDGQGWLPMAKAGLSDGQGPFAPKAETAVKFCSPKLQKLKLSSTFASRSSKIRQISRNLDNVSRISSDFVKSREYCRESIIFSSGGARGGKANPTLARSKAGQGRPRPAKAGQGRPRLAKALLLQNLKLSSNFVPRSSKS